MRAGAVLLIKQNNQKTGDPLPPVVRGKMGRGGDKKEKK